MFWKTENSMKVNKNSIKRKLASVLLPVLLLALVIGGCGKENPGENSSAEESLSWSELTGITSEGDSAEQDSVAEVGTEDAQENQTSEEATESTAEPVTEEASTEPAPEQTGNGKVIVIDAGHQQKGNNEKEPIGPGATETKAKVTGGATGCSTGQKEYELNLAVAFLLKDELIARGYEVIMVRESHDVDMSNSERAAVANDANADAFIRIHANGASDSSVNGAMTLCQTASNPYNGHIYEECRSLSEHVLDGVVNRTGFKKRSIMETNTMSGINWCQVPVTIVEMGFLSNPTEDSQLATDEYRSKVALGIADGLDSYFQEWE